MELSQPTKSATWLVNLLHLVILVPFLFYVALSRKQQWLSVVLVVVASVVVLFHGRNLIRSKGKNMVSWLHVVVVAPLFIFAALRSESQESYIMWVFITLAVIVALVHGYRLKLKISEKRPASGSRSSTVSS
jgi:FtsH-binding integral membrane protein